MNAPMLPLDAFLLGGFLVAMGTIGLLGGISIYARRRAVVRDREQKDGAVRLAFFKLAMQLRDAERRSRVKYDMPAGDRLRDAQGGTIVAWGITVTKAAAHG